MPPGQLFASKREYVYATLRGEILEGVREPEERLVIDEIATRLGVSPIPVREALQQLQHDGLVVIEPYVGAHVAAMHAGLIEEIFALLEAFEIISSRRATVRMHDDDLAALEQMLKRMDRHVGDLEAWSQANVEWHRLIMQFGDLTMVPAMLDQALDQWQRLRQTYLEDVFVRRVERAQAEHWELLDAMRTRDPARVAALISDHNRNALDDYLAHLHRNGHLQWNDGRRHEAEQVAGEIEPDRQ